MDVYPCLARSGGPLVDFLGVFDRPRDGSAIGGSVHLRCVDLLAALVEPDAIGEIRELSRSGVPSLHRFGKQAQSVALEIELTVGELGQQPGMIGILLADETVSR